MRGLHPRNTAGKKVPRAIQRLFAGLGDLPGAQRAHGLAAVVVFVCNESRAEANGIADDTRWNDHSQRGALPPFADFEHIRARSLCQDDPRIVDDIDLKRRMDRRVSRRRPLHDPGFGGDLLRFAHGHRRRTAAKRVDLNREAASRYRSRCRSRCRYCSRRWGRARQRRSRQHQEHTRYQQIADLLHNRSPS